MMCEECEIEINTNTLNTHIIVSSASANTVH